MARQREQLEAKASRYLRQGRIIVQQVLGDQVVAAVRGMTGVYEVRHQRGGWSCTCPAQGLCSHLVAVGLVTPPGVWLVADE